MIVRLHNLSARAPMMTDLNAVIALVNLCEYSESETSEALHADEDIHNTWQAPCFSLKADAWVIVTNKGQIVGYADVRYSENGQFSSFIRVHPDYRGRGIGTLLIWLTEERARQLVRRVSLGRRITLSHTVSSLNQAACELYERESYSLARSFWRLMLDMENVPAYNAKEAYRQGKIKIDLVVGTQSNTGTTYLHRHDGMYVAQQYNVYEKELRAGVELCPAQSSIAV